jgi:hypothetical protein
MDALKASVAQAQGLPVKTEDVAEKAGKKMAASARGRAAARKKKSG